MRDRALTLAEDPLRCQSLPNMLAAEWDLVELLMTSMSESYPEHFTLTREGDAWHWINRPMGIEQKFIFGDVSTLPNRPMEYITRQCQGDSACSTSETAICGWMPASSRPRPTGRSTSMSV